MHPGLRFAPKKIAPNKKVGSRPLDRATYLEASQYKVPTPKTQDRLRDTDSPLLSRQTAFRWLTEDQYPILELAVLIPRRALFPIP